MLRESQATVGRNPAASLETAVGLAAAGYAVTVVGRDAVRGGSAVERRTDPGRGRTAELHVTATGQELLRAGRDAYAEVDAVLERVLGKQRRQDLTGLLLSALSAGSSGRG